MLAFAVLAFVLTLTLILLLMRYARQLSLRDAHAKMCEGVSPATKVAHRKRSQRRERRAPHRVSGADDVVSDEEADRPRMDTFAASHPTTNKSLDDMLDAIVRKHAGPSMGTTGHSRQGKYGLLPIPQNDDEDDDASCDDI